MKTEIEKIKQIQNTFLDKTLEHSRFGYARNPRSFFKTYYSELFTYLVKEYKVDYESAKKILEYAKANDIPLKSLKVKQLLHKCYNTSSFLKNKKGICKQFTQAFLLSANLDEVKKELTKYNPFVLGFYEGKTFSRDEKVLPTHLVPFIREGSEEFLIDPTMASIYSYSRDCYLLAKPDQYDFNFKRHTKGRFERTSETVFDKDLSLEDMYEIMTSKTIEGQQSGYTKTIFEKQ